LPIGERLIIDTLFAGGDVGSSTAKEMLPGHAIADYGNVFIEQPLCLDIPHGCTRKGNTAI
jgi:hypothetical protein